MVEFMSFLLPQPKLSQSNFYVMILKFVDGHFVVNKTDFVDKVSWGILTAIIGFIIE